MWKKSVLFFVSVFCFTGCEPAPDSGVWSGSGTYQEDGGISTPCNYIRADISRDDRYLSIANVSSDCGFKYLTWGPASFDIYGDSLYRMGENVGYAHTDGTTRFELNDPYMGSKVIVSWSRTEGHLIYSEDVYGPGGHYAIRAVLRRDY